MTQASCLDSTQACRVLDYDQVRRLHDVLLRSVAVHGRGNFPTLELSIADFVRSVRNRLNADGIAVKQICVNGGAASYVIGTGMTGVSISSETLVPLSTDVIDTADMTDFHGKNGSSSILSGVSNVKGTTDGLRQLSYNDVDLIFCVDLSQEDDLHRVRDAVLASLISFLPPGASADKLTAVTLSDAYVHKMFRVYTNHDRWSLISLRNDTGRNVELKFVDKMRRQYEFSVDSFQITLEGLLAFLELTVDKEIVIGKSFYPTVSAASAYGDFAAAELHLAQRLIATRNPEEIRGGGLLKYCNLLSRSYKPAPDVDISVLERYMCSRFFIDFPDAESQRSQLLNYLANHFGVYSERNTDDTGKKALMTESVVCAKKGFDLTAAHLSEHTSSTGLSDEKLNAQPAFNENEDQTIADSKVIMPGVWDSNGKPHGRDIDTMRYQYLACLHDVVNRSTVCLMGYERQQILTLIAETATAILFNMQHAVMLSKAQRHFGEIQPYSPDSQMIAMQMWMRYSGNQLIIPCHTAMTGDSFGKPMNDGQFVSQRKEDQRNNHNRSISRKYNNQRHRGTSPAIGTMGTAVCHLALPRPLDFAGSRHVPGTHKFNQVFMVGNQRDFQRQSVPAQLLPYSPYYPPPPLHFPYGQ